ARGGSWGSVESPEPEDELGDTGGASWWPCPASWSTRRTTALGGSPLMRLSTDAATSGWITKVSRRAISTAQSKTGGPVRSRMVCRAFPRRSISRSEEHTSELQSLAYLVCRLLLEKKK